VTAGSHTERVGNASLHGYGIPLFTDKIYRDFQVKGLLRAAARRLALSGILKKALPAGTGTAAAQLLPRDFRHRPVLAMPGASA
jgi:hypothetical protein